MARVNLVEPTAASGEAATLLKEINQAFGVTPNMFRAVANSPAALKSMWGAFGALGQGRIGPKLGEQIAVAIADRNDCQYCLSAHTALGRKAEAGRSSDPKTAAALAFALKVVENRAQLSDGDVRALREAGFDDGEIVEILAHVALNLFTNYVNVAFDVPLDFPAVQLRKAA